MKTYTYFAFGLTIRSDFELFSIPTAEGVEHCDLTISKVNHKLLELPESVHFIQKNTPEGIIYHLNNIATFLIQADDHIYLNQYADEDELVESALMKGVMSAYLTSKGYYIFSGAAVLIKNKAQLFMGVPGVGLSAITAGLHKLGYPILSDEKIILKKEGEGFSLIPSLTYSKLWKVMVEQFGLELKIKAPVRQKLTKYYVDLVPFQSKEQYHISKNVIIEINPTGKMELASIRLADLEIVESLNKHIYNGVEQTRDNKLSTFKVLTALATNCKNYRITRPRAVYDVEEFVDFIVSDTHE